MKDFMLEGGRPELMREVRELAELCQTDPDSRYVIMNVAINLVGWAEARNPGPPLQALNTAVKSVAVRQGMAGPA